MPYPDSPAPSPTAIHHSLPQLWWLLPGPACWRCGDTAWHNDTSGRPCHDCCEIYGVLPPAHCPACDASKVLNRQHKRNHPDLYSL